MSIKIDKSAYEKLIKVKTKAIIGRRNHEEDHV